MKFRNDVITGILISVAFLSLFGAANAVIRITDTGVYDSTSYVYYAKSYATGGSGTSDYPYTGWQDSVLTILNNSEATVIFTQGIYECETAHSDHIDRTFCLKVGQNDKIIGDGNAWLTQDGLNLNAFIIDESNWGHVTSWKGNIEVSGMNFDGNTATAYGGTNGTANPIAFHYVENSRITNIYAKNYGLYGAVWLQGRNNIINDIICDHSIVSGGYYVGHCVFNTGSQSYGNTFDSINGYEVSNVLEFEDNVKGATVGTITGTNIDGAVLAIIGGKHISVDTINGNNVTRGMLISQASGDLVVGNLMVNKSTDGANINTYGDENIIISNAMLTSTTTGFTLVNITNLTVKSVLFDNVATKLTKSGTNTDLNIYEKSNMIEGNARYTNDLYVGSESGGSVNVKVQSTDAGQKCLVFMDGTANGWQICEQAGSNTLFFYNGGFHFYLTQTGEIDLPSISGDGSGKAVCIKADGNLGTCTDAVGAGGTCTCT